MASKESNNISIEIYKLGCDTIMEKNAISVESCLINHVVGRKDCLCNESDNLPLKVQSPKHFGATSTFHIVEHRDCTDMFVEYLENNGCVASEGRQELVRILIRSPSDVSITSSTTFKDAPEISMSKDNTETLQLSPVYEKRGRFLVWPTRFRK